MLEFRPTLHAEDLRKIALHPRDDIELVAEIPVAEFVEDVIQTSKSRGGTWFDNGEPVIAGGFTEIKPGIEFAWFIASRDIKPHVRKIWPVVREYLRASSGIVTTVVTKGGIKQERFVRHLGFVPGSDGNYFLKAQS